MDAASTAPSTSASTAASLPWSEPPASIEMARPFWDAVARGRLVLPRCSVCNRWQWYPEAFGTDCAGGSLVWEAVPATGTVYACTTVHRSFLPGAPSQAPYTVALIDLDGVVGPRLVAPLTDDAAIGDRVRAQFLDAGDHTALAFAKL